MINIEVGLGLAMSALADPGRPARGYFHVSARTVAKPKRPLPALIWAEELVLSCVLAHPYVRCQGSRCAAQLVRAETVALKGPMLPEVSTARTRK